MRTTFAVGLNYPQGLAFDSAGSLFVSDGDAIYKFNLNGVRTTFASGLSGPIGLAFDSAGNLFVADNGIGGVYKFTPEGVRTTFASGLSTVSVWRLTVWATCLCRLTGGRHPGRG